MRLDININIHPAPTEGDPLKALTTAVTTLIARSMKNMKTIIEAINEVQTANAEGTARLLAAIDTEKQEVAAAVGEAVAAAIIERDATIADLRAQLAAAGTTLTDEQVAALKAPFDGLLESVQTIVQPGAAPA